VPLILRWPFLCFRKVARLVSEVANYPELKRGAPLKFYLTPYFVDRAVHLPEGDLTLACHEAPSVKVENYSWYLGKFPLIYFLKNEVLAAEELFADLRQTDEGYQYEDKRLYCTSANVGELAQITVFYMLDWLVLFQWERFKYVSEAWSPDRHLNKAIVLPPQGLVQLTPQEVWPRWTSEGAAMPAPPKLDLATIQNFVIARGQEGQSDPVALAQEIDSLYPGLTDGQLGALLPTAFFPKQGRVSTRIFKPGLYDGQPQVSAAANRKRGQRLRGKVK
jgi:hypothetical protein